MVEEGGGTLGLKGGTWGLDIGEADVETFGDLVREDPCSKHVDKEEGNAFIVSLISVKITTW